MNVDDDLTNPFEDWTPEGLGEQIQTWLAEEWQRETELIPIEYEDGSVIMTHVWASDDKEPT